SDLLYLSANSRPGPQPSLGASAPGYLPQPCGILGKPGGPPTNGTTIGDHRGRAFELDLFCSGDDGWRSDLISFRLRVTNEPPPGNRGIPFMREYPTGL
ncbi:MAG: hypothetical protein ABUK16_09320, partial [Anaerolineales bacterium]